MRARRTSGCGVGPPECWPTKAQEAFHRRAATRGSGTRFDVISLLQSAFPPFCSVQGGKARPRFPPAVRESTSAKRCFARAAPPHSLPQRRATVAFDHLPFALRAGARGSRRDVRSAALFLFCTAAHGVAHGGARALCGGARAWPRRRADSDGRNRNPRALRRGICPRARPRRGGRVPRQGGRGGHGEQARLVGAAGERLRCAPSRSASKVLWAASARRGMAIMPPRRT